MLRSLRLASFLTGRRRTLSDALEEAVDRTAEASLTVTTLVGASIKDGQRFDDTCVTALTGRHAFAVGGLVKNGRQLAVATGVAAAALDEQHRCHEDFEERSFHGATV